MYEVKNTPNKKISLHFARGVILMSLGKKVSWSQFRDERREHRNSVKRNQVENAKHRSTKAKQVPANLSKRRCMAPDFVFPTSLALKVK